MKITMLQSIAGATFSLAAGDPTDRFTDKEAKRLIAAGIAEPYTGPASTEAQKALADENAVLAERVDELVKTVARIAEMLSDVRSQLDGLVAKVGEVETIKVTVGVVQNDLGSLVGRIASIEAISATSSKAKS